EAEAKPIIFGAELGTRWVSYGTWLRRNTLPPTRSALRRTQTRPKLAQQAKAGRYCALRTMNVRPRLSCRLGFRFLIRSGKRAHWRFLGLGGLLLCRRRRGGRRLLGRVARQAQRPQPFGLRPRRYRLGLVVGHRLLGIVRPLQLGELRLG